MSVGGATVEPAEVVVEVPVVVEPAVVVLVVVVDVVPDEALLDPTLEEAAGVEPELPLLPAVLQLPAPVV